MMEFCLISGLYLVAGLTVVIFLGLEQFIPVARWWHVLIWPLLLVGWVLTAIGFWMAGER